MLHDYVPTSTKEMASFDSVDKTSSQGPGIGTHKRSHHILLLRGGFQSIVQDEYFRESNLASGQALYKAGHVLWAEERQQHGVPGQISGECVPQTNINNKPYQVELHLDESRSVKDAFCQCVAGIQGRCKHSAAVFHYINSERTSSCTDKEQVWHEPPKSKQELYCKGLPASNVFKFPPTPSPSFSASDDYKKQLHSDLETYGMGKSSLCKSLAAQLSSDSMVSMEASTDQDQNLSTIPDAVKLLFYNEIIVQGDENKEIPMVSCRNFYESEVKVSTEEALKIMIDTKQQSFSPAWHNERKKRISASKAHQIANARKEETALKYFQYVTSDHANLQYGRTMENFAREAYKKVSGNVVHACGLFVKPCQPWMSCTPDGIAQDTNGNLIALEIKCPISCQRNKINVPWLSEAGLKETHPYYCQVQIQLYCCNLDKAHFFVYSESDSVLVEIMRNDTFL